MKSYIITLWRCYEIEVFSGMHMAALHGGWSIYGGSQVEYQIQGF